MRYKNTKTGAVINSSFIIKGKNWKEAKPKSKRKTTKKEEPKGGD